jgi:NAD(P)-dependent dehydrogenase (short-subunit alcohol dehydrogenase family)
MQPQLTGKVALITGAGSGIGKSAALLMGAAGARIVALSRTLKEVEQAADEIRQAGGDAFAVQADVSAQDQMRAAVRLAVERWGRLDVVFANAGVNGVWAPLEDLSLEDWNRAFDINLTGTFLTVQAALPHLKKQGGSIIVCSSVNGTRVFSNTGATAYACTKAAQVAFTKMLALELAPHRIRINVICPGWIDTQIGDNMEVRNLETRIGDIWVPLTGNQPGRPEQVASLALFLASDASDHITGTEVWIDGGESLLRGY